MKHLSVIASCLVVASSNVLAQGSRYALRLYGTGTGQQDRVRISIDPEVPVDVGSDFTLDFWMRAEPGDNPNGAAFASGDGWIYGHIILDRDVFYDGDYGDYGISMGTVGNPGAMVFGVARGGTGNTVVGTNNVADGAWRHVAVTRTESNGTLRIYVDGILDAQDWGPTGNVSYRDGRATSYPDSDPFLVFGAEKHDAGSSYPSFNGHLDEVRMWTNVLDVAALSNVFDRIVDPAEYPGLVAYWRFEEGTNTFIGDSAGGGSTGTLASGIAGNGEWVSYMDNSSNTAPVRPWQPRIENMGCAANEITFQWFGQQNYRYSVETNGNLQVGSGWGSPSAWTNFTATDSTVVFTGNTGSAATRFLRVVGAPSR